MPASRAPNRREHLIAVLSMRDSFAGKWCGERTRIIQEIVIRLVTHAEGEHEARRAQAVAAVECRSAAARKFSYKRSKTSFARWIDFGVTGKIGIDGSARGS